MEQKILTASSASQLNSKVEAAIKDGFTPVGGHTCVETLHQHSYSGMQPSRTQITLEYAQTVRNVFVISL